MKVRFKVNYHTHWGQKLYVTGSASALGNQKEDNALEMQYLPNGDWEAIVDLKKTKAKQLTYSYFIKDTNNGIVQYEKEKERTLHLGKNVDFINVEDTWRTAKGLNSVYNSSAFSKAVFRTCDDSKSAEKTSPKAPQATNEQGTLFIFEIDTPRIAKGYSVAVMGNVAELGNWDSNKKVPMLKRKSCGSRWFVELPIDNNYIHIQYKYVIVEDETGNIVDMENGDDRDFFLGAEGEKHENVLSDGAFRYSSSLWKGSGVALPVFSLKTKNSLGVGEFLDIKLLVDWAKKTGMKMVQILPVNDTIATHTWVDSYPYAAISVYALHPQYINVETIGKLRSKAKMEELKAQKEALNALAEIDYEKVMDTKMTYLRELWNEKKVSFYKNKTAQKFIEEHKKWLIPYAAFSFLREQFGTPDFSTWKKLSVFDQKQVDALFEAKSKVRDEVYFYIFLQYHLHLQLLEAAEYARKNNIVLKGDIPIGIYRNSADAWSEPELYNMNGQAGAPPDDFAVNGQNWGFPTYNWDAMKADGYQWWKSRMTHLSQYFEAFRIDHILGFFRIWEIPIDSVQGLLGQFRPAIPIHINELHERGIHFDYNRLCKPYIREHFIWDVFGGETQYVKDTFFNQYAEGCYEFKEEFSSQRKVQAYFNEMKPANEEEKAKNEWLRDTLYSLHNEVLLLPALGYDDGHHFAPRVTMNASRTFQELSEHERNALWNLYVDYFFRRQEGLWREQAMEKLPAITKATDMLICGEDLGMVPDCVPGVMEELDILSLEIQRMPKDSKITFGHPADYPYMSVASTSTHDMSTVRGWWEESTEETQQFYNQILGHWGGSPFYCESWVAKDILNQHFYSPAMWAVLPLQDLLAMDSELRKEDAQSERINIPAIKHHYWRYRTHLSMEELLDKDRFNSELKDLITRSGRNTPF